MSTIRRLAPAIVGLAAVASAALAQEPVPPHAGAGGHDHDATVHHRFDDVERWSKVFDDPARDAWQKPEDLIRFLAVKPGQAVADLGAGTGYFTTRLARAVGPSGKVFGVDIEPTLVEHIRERAAKERLPQIVAVLAAPDDPKLPEHGVDLILVCDTWHHIDDRTVYLGKLARVLRSGGRVAVVDYRPGDQPVGPPPEHKLPPERVVEEFQQGGFGLAGRSEALPYQYVLVFAPR